MQHSRKYSNVDLRSTLKSKHDISLLNILGTIKKLIEPPCQKSKRESLNNSPRKNSNVFIQVKERRNLSQSYKSQIFRLQDRENLKNNCLMKILTVPKQSESKSGNVKIAWSDTVKSIIASSTDLKAKSEKSSSDESLCNINKPKCTKSMKYKEKSNNYSSYVKNHSNSLFSVRPFAKSAEIKSKLDEPKEVNMYESNEPRIDVNVMLKPYIYAKVTRKRLYNKLKL